jgi:hypothetical protein
LSHLDRKMMQKAVLTTWYRPPVDTSFSFWGPAARSFWRGIFLCSLCLLGPLMKIMINCSQEWFSMILS